LILKFKPLKFAWGISSILHWFRQVYSTPVWWFVVYFWLQTIWVFEGRWTTFHEYILTLTSKLSRNGDEGREQWYILRYMSGQTHYKAGGGILPPVWRGTLYWLYWSKFKTLKFAWGISSILPWFRQVYSTPVWWFVVYFCLQTSWVFEGRWTTFHE
jgi:hypothetical protein